MHAHHLPKASPAPRPSPGFPGPTAPDLTPAVSQPSLVVGKPQHSAENLYSSDYVPKKHYPDKLNLCGKNKATCTGIIPSQAPDNNPCSKGKANVAEKPPAVVQGSDQMAIGNQTPNSEITINIANNSQHVDETDQPTEPMTVGDKPVVGCLNVTPDTGPVLEDLTPAPDVPTNHLDLRCDSDVSDSTTGATEVAPSSGYPTETSTLLIRGVDPGNNLTHAHGADLASTHNTATVPGEGLGSMSVRTTSDNLSNCDPLWDVGLGVRDQSEAMEKYQSQTKPKELSPVIPRGCGFGSIPSAAYPIQETIKSN